MSQAITEMNGLLTIIGQRQSGVSTTALAMLAALYGTQKSEDSATVKHFLSFSTDAKEMFDVSLATAGGSRYSTNNIQHFHIGEGVDNNALKFINDVIYKFYSDVQPGNFRPVQIVVYIDRVLDYMTMEQLHQLRDKFPKAYIIATHSLDDYKTSSKAAKLQLLYGSDNHAIEVLSSAGVSIGNMDILNQHYLVNNLRSIINA